jgi:hypothetical protein
MRTPSIVAADCDPTVAGYRLPRANPTPRHTAPGSGSRSTVQALIVSIDNDFTVAADIVT